MILCLVIFFFLQIVDPFGLKKRLQKEADIAPEVVEENRDVPKLHPTGHPRQFYTLGSVAENSNDCLLVTLDSRGASVRRVELVQRDAKGRFLTREVENKSGYLGYLELLPDGTEGALIQAVPAGSPFAQAAALGNAPLPVIAGDRLISMDDQPILSDEHLQQFLNDTRAGQQVTVKLARLKPNATATAPLSVELVTEPTQVPVPTTESTATQDNKAGEPAGDAATQAGTETPSTETPSAATPEILTDTRMWEEYSATITLMDRPKQMMGPEYRQVDGSEASYPGTFEFSLQDAKVTGEWQELDLAMQQGNWEGRQYTDATGRPCVEFTYRLPKDVYQRLLRTSKNLTESVVENAEVVAEVDPANDPAGAIVVVKRFRLPVVAPEERNNPAVAGYHIEMEVELYNETEKPLEVAYRLGGPVATSIEGWWYQIKLHGGFWKIGYSAGARDIVTGSTERPYNFFGRAEIDSEVKKNGTFTVFPRNGTIEERTVRYAAVDTLYFASAMLPQPKPVAGADPATVTDYVCYSGFAGPVGKIYPGRDAMKQDLSFRVYNTVSLPAAEKNQAENAAALPDYQQSFHLFAGPKRPELLATYKLDDTVSFGWFGMFSLPLLWLLHLFYYIVGNYAIAIILLTVVVRLLMMPISRKAVINAQMMQALAPEMKKIKEKYPDNLEKQGLANRELFRRFKYNPFSGCLIVFLQLPIFIGLYRGLSVDFELRDQPLIPGMNWCSNMAGPDQLWNWSNYLPGFIASETGWLGPYFNVLPLVTIVLFILQQKIFMPPPTDEQQAMMQKMMSYMMIFMGFLFFKVPAGLCIYFITSSIWGLIERAVIPKPQLSQEILDSINRDGDLPPTMAAKPAAAEGKTQLDEKSRQELRDRDKERQKRLKDKRKD